LLTVPEFVRRSTEIKITKLSSSNLGSLQLLFITYSRAIRDKFSDYDKEVLKRIEDIKRLDEDTKSKLFFLIDNVIQNFQAKQAFS
jgi:hypothetical protein